MQKPSSPSGWASATETAQFSAPNLSSSAWFGSTISISGKSLLIGGSSTSAAYLFQQPTGGWQSTSTPDATILSTDPNQQSFGNAVAIAGSTLVVGDSHAGADSSW